MEDGASRSRPPKPTTGAGSPGVMMLPAAWLLAIGRRPCFCISHRREAGPPAGLCIDWRAQWCGRRIYRDLLSRPASCMLRDSTRRGSGAPAASCYQTHSPAECGPSRPSTTVPVVAAKMLRERTNSTCARATRHRDVVGGGRLALSHSVRWKRSRPALP